MTYKSVTHTIVELMARKKIKAVPRKDEIDRVDLKNVARPDDDRKGDVPTRQGEIQAKVIDEQELGPIDPKEVKKPKKLEIQDVGKQPPTQVIVNPELDNTPNLFASTEVKGKPIAEADYKHPAIDPKTKKSFDSANKLKSFQKSHDFQGGDDTPDPRARRDAEEIAKFAKQFQGKSFGGFKITGKLTAADIEQGARIRARLNKLKESEDKPYKVVRWKDGKEQILHLPNESPEAYPGKREYKVLKAFKERWKAGDYKMKTKKGRKEVKEGLWRQERQKKVIDEDTWYITAKTTKFIGNAPGGKHKIHKIEKTDGGHDVYIRGGTHSFHIPDKKHSTGETSYKITRKSSSMPLDVHTAHRMINEDKYNNVSIQYQTKNGQWVTVRKTTDQPSDIMMALANVQKTYSSNRVRAISSRGTVLDMWPIDPVSLQQEEKNTKETINERWREQGQKVKWKDPNYEKEYEEVAGQHQASLRDREHFPDWVRERLGQLKDKNEWTRATSRGKATDFDYKKHIATGQVGNTGDSWKDITNPKYSDQSSEEKTKQKNAPWKIETRISAGKRIRRPIYLRNPKTGEHWLISGHHRTTYVGDVMGSKISAHVIENTTEDKDYVEVRGRKIYGFKGSPGHKQMEKAAQKHADREAKRQKKESINELKKSTLLSFRNKAEKKPQKDAREMKNLWTGIWRAEKRLSGERVIPKKRGGMRKYHFESSEASKEEKEAFEKFMKYPSGKEHEKGMHQALQAFRAMYFRRKYKEQNEDTKLDETSYKKAKSYIRASQQNQWDLNYDMGDEEERKLSNRIQGVERAKRIMKRKRGVKEDTINEYEGLGIGAMHRRQKPSDHKPASGWAGYGKPTRKKSELQNRGLPDIEKTYGAFRRQRERDPVKEDTSIQDLKKAKKRIINAWWENRGDSTKNIKNIKKAISKKELDEQKKDKFTQELGQRGATGTWGTPFDKVSTTLKPGTAEAVRSWAQRASTPEYIGTTATTSAVSAVTGVSTLPLMLKGDEMRRKPKSEETILRVLDKIVKDN